MANNGLKRTASKLNTTGKLSGRSNSTSSSIPSTPKRVCLDPGISELESSLTTPNNKSQASKLGDGGRIFTDDVEQNGKETLEESEMEVDLESEAGDNYNQERANQLVNASVEEKLSSKEAAKNPTGSAATLLNGTVESSEWLQTTENVVKSVVSVQFANVTSFDTEPALVSEATGFVVDAVRGIIMTNRHVVGSGPFVGYAVFDNHEECDVWPVYRDPVHDFGFLRFDPSKIRHMAVQELSLRPELAKVGCEIRVVGNDAGEKLSILAGFISRLDRNAPYYGDLTYNDFNIEYIQAAAATSGGSSGSPVVNIDGQVVALQAGGSTSASTDFFLPLHRGKRVLELLQQDKYVTRGTIQTQWLLKPFDECRRLGLSAESEKISRQRFPDAIGLLVAETVLPEGPGDGLIREGDCLISINGQPIAKFARIDEILDESVDKEISVVVERNGEQIEFPVKVGDLHSITPDRYVEVSGVVAHDMSYQVARFYSIPVRGVYLSDASGWFRAERGGESTGWIIDEIDDKLTPNLDEFIKVMQEIPDGDRVAIRYRHVTDLYTVKTSIVYIDKHWRRNMSLAVRNDKTGLWDFRDITKPAAKQELTRKTARFARIKLETESLSKLTRSFVKVASRITGRIEGYSSAAMAEYGLVLDAEQGYVLATRFVVPHDMCDVHVTVAESVIVPAKVVFLHPLYNFAIIKYDPSLVDAEVETAKLGNQPLSQGDSVTFVGHNHNFKVVAARTRVTDISTVVIPLSPDVAPRYRATNLDSIAVDTALSGDSGSGVLADDDGTVRAIWMSLLGDTTPNGRDKQYRLALDVGHIRKIVEELRAGKQPNPRFLDAEVQALSIAHGRIRGVSEEWINRVFEAKAERHQLFCVNRVASGAASSLKEGDIILAVNGKTVTQTMDLDLSDDTATLVDVTLVRNRQEISVKVPTVSANDLLTDRVITWCGIVMHAPHHAVRQQLKKTPSDVYVTESIRGSPANMYNIASTYFITHVNGQATPTLDKFFEVVKSIPDNTYVKLRVVTFDNLPCACSIKTNFHYFPTSEKRRMADGTWKSIIYEDDKTIENAC